MSAVITAMSGVTSLGCSIPAISAAIRGPISGFAASEEYADRHGERIVVSEFPRIQGITDDLNRTNRLRAISQFSLESLIETVSQKRARAEQVFLLVGLAAPGQRGSRDREYLNQLEVPLSAVLNRRFGRSAIRFFESGNPAALEALDYGCQFLKAHPQTVCIIGGVDSLLDVETLDRLESEDRLKSASYGRSHGLVPGEGVGFLMVESAEYARRRERVPLATVLGIGLAREPSPFHSLEPSALTGLTEACDSALSHAGVDPAAIGSVIGNLNGEFHRHKEWAYAELRCLRAALTERDLWHPADCFGDVGAASGALLVNFGVSLLVKRRQSRGPVLCFCSDDDEARGAVILGADAPAN
jgi:3-oxoacyl-[acyl-carrier-protein] synthase I